MSMHSMSEIQKALAERRGDLPSDRYFSGVVAEFHARQRTVMFEKRSWRERFTESLKDLWFFQPVRLVQGAAFAVVLVFFTLNGLHESWNSTSSTLAEWFQNPVTSPSSTAVSEHFLTSNTMDQLNSSALAQPIELVSFSVVDSGTERTQYVMNSVPAAYDAVVSF